MGLTTISRFVQFPFQEKDLLQFSDATKIHCDPKANVLSLRADADDKYPLTSDLFVRGPLLNPTAVRQWGGIQFHRAEPQLDLVEVGSVRYRLHDGTKDYWWDGTKWDDAPIAGEWNTSVQVQDHIATFPVVSQKLRVVFNLKTINADYTPLVYDYSLHLRVAVESWQEEVILRTIIPALRDNVRPTADVAYPWPGGTTLDLDSVPLKEPITTTNITAAYNITDDPNKITDILLSYNTGTHVVTLVGAVAAGKKVILRHEYAPEVALTTDPDYDEIAKIPAILLTDIDEKLTRHGAEKTSVVNEGTLVASSLRAPRQVSLAIALKFNARRMVELMRLADATQTYLSRNPLLHVKSLDSQIVLVIQEEPSMAPRGDSAHVLEQGMVVSVRSVEKWFDQPEAGYGVKQVQVGGDMDIVVT